GIIAFMYGNTRARNMPAPDPKNPRALGCCDRCNFVYFHHELVWDTQWQGPKLGNLRLLVCPSCKDKPQEQLRTIVIPADTVPTKDPRPENYAATVYSSIA